MRYTRPKNKTALNKEQKLTLMKEYVEHYDRVYRASPDTLNRKVPREAFRDLLERIGGLLLLETKTLASRPVIRKFLDTNPLPKSMRGLLPADFRVLCLSLNALKQWVSAEQQATDRYLFGGTARATFRLAASKCIVTGQALEGNKIALHHPVRDGRPPIPLSEQGHALIEGQVADKQKTGDIVAVVRLIKKNGHHSWGQLRRGCEDHLGRKVSHSTDRVRATSRSFARRVAKETGMTYDAIIHWLRAAGLAGKGV